MQQAEGKGRIVAIRVSDADFELLDGLKRMKGIGWNQLLLVPVETAYGVTLETAHPAVKEKVVVEPEEEKPKKGKAPKKTKGPSKEIAIVEPLVAGEPEELLIVEAAEEEPAAEVKVEE